MIVLQFLFQILIFVWDFIYLLIDQIILFYLVITASSSSAAVIVLNSNIILHLFKVVNFLFQFHQLLYKFLILSFWQFYICTIIFLKWISILRVLLLHIFNWLRIVNQFIPIFLLSILILSFSVFDVTFRGLAHSRWANIPLVLALRL